MHATQNTVAEQVTTPARTLRDAALYLSRHGWTQGAYYDQTATCFTPAACAVGAIGMVCYGGPVDAPALNDRDPGYGPFTDAVAWVEARIRDWDESIGDVYTYNDAPGRTCDEVVATLHAAADVWDRTNGTPIKDGCRCGDSYCADVMPRDQDRSGCCQYCGFYDCDVCGWSATDGGAA